MYNKDEIKWFMTRSCFDLYSCDGVVGPIFFLYNFKEPQKTYLNYNL